MATTPTGTTSHSPTIETHLLGIVPYADCLALQQRLVYEISGRDDGQIALLLCEHPSVITIGRAGSACDVDRTSGLVRHHRMDVRWVNRGGGAVLHTPGQLAIYPIVPLRWHGFTVGEYLHRLQHGILQAFDESGIQGKTIPGRHGIWGRTGQLATIGVAVRGWVTYHGAYINVSPPLGLFRIVETDRIGHTRISSLVAERGPSARMASIRASVIRHLAESLGCQRYHLYTGHPLLRRCSRLELRAREAM